MIKYHVELGPAEEIPRFFFEKNPRRVQASPSATILVYYMHSTSNEREQLFGGWFRT